MGSGAEATDPVIRLAHEAITGNGHDGGTFGMTSQVVLFPDEHEGYVLLANDACSGTESALKELAIELHANRLSD